MSDKVARSLGEAPAHIFLGSSLDGPRNPHSKGAQCALARLAEEDLELFLDSTQSSSGSIDPDVLRADKELAHVERASTIDRARYCLQENPERVDVLV